MRRSIGSILVLGGLLLTGVYHYDSEVNEPVFSPEMGNSNRAPAQAHPEILPSGERPTPLQGQYSYRFVRKIKVDLNSKKLTDIAYSGKFFVSIENQNEGGYLATASYLLGTSAYRNSLQGDTHPESKLSLQAHFRKDGLLLDLREPDEFSKQKDLIEMKNILKDLLAQWSFFNFEDSTGNYEARLLEEATSSTSSNVRVFKKQKVKYLSSEFSGLEMRSSEHHYVWDVSHGRAKEISGIDVSGIQNSHQALETENSYSIVFERFDAALTPKGSRPKGKLTQLKIDAEESSDDEHPSYAHLSWGKMKPKLLTLSHLSRSEKLAVFSDLVLLLKKDPETLTHIKSLLQSHRGNESLYRTAIGALATFGSEKAQESLIELFNEGSRSNHQQVKHMILASLTTTEKPLTPKTQNFLEQMISQTSDSVDPGLTESAALALGSALRIQNSHQNTSAVEPSSAQKLLGDKLSQTQSPGEQATYLDAIGNSGRAEYLPVIERYLQASSAEVRQKAILSLRWMETPDASQLLNQLLSARELTTRRAALQAISYRHSLVDRWSEHVETLKRCSEKDESLEIRNECSRLKNMR